MKDLITLTELFKNSIFRIPSYQRGYSWEYEQLEEFWDDIYNLQENKEHYTGMLSLKELDQNSNSEELKLWNDADWLLKTGYHAYHIVDGQQRLTTIIILIQSIIEIYQKNNSTKKNEEIVLNDTRLSEIIEQFIVRKKPGSADLISTYLLGYEVDKPSDDYLKNKILNPTYVGEINESFYTVNLDNAKDFFQKRLNELYGEDKFESIEKIFKKVINKLKFNVYHISNDFNVNVAFETMNNRGKRLSNLELLKNRLIYLGTLLSLPQDEEKALLDSINDTWKTIYSYLGKNKLITLPDDDFLIAHSYIYFGYIEDIRKGYSQFLLKKYFSQARLFNGMIYDNISTNIADEEEEDFITEDNDIYIDITDKLTKKDIIDYINSLKSLVPYWYMLHFAEYDGLKEINDWLTKLNRLEYNYFKPLVLVCLSKNDISDDKKLELIRAVERFIFIVFRLCGYQATYNRNNIYNYMHQLYNDEIEIDKIIDFVKKLEVLSDNNVLQYSSISSTIARLFKREGFYIWKANRYFLYEYETSLVERYSGTSKISNDYFLPPKRTDKLSIEHIFPQSESSTYWNKIFINYSTEEKNRLRGSLGNLLPLSLSINRELQDDEFNTKKIRYEIGSYSEQEIAKHENWNDETILERGMKLIEFLENRWSFKFVNDKERKQFLGLDFLIDDDDISSNVTRIINNEQPEEKYRDVEEPLYLSINGEIYATGQYKDGKLVVFKGSKIRTDIDPGSNTMRKKIEKEREKLVLNNNYITEDTSYSSPSLAANVVLGNHKNGWQAWKNKLGITLDELVERSNINIDKYIKNASDDTKAIFNELNKRINEISEQIDMRFTNSYIGYRVEQNFLELHINKNNLLCYTVNGDMYKTNHDVEHVPESSGWAVDTKFYIRSLDDLNKYWPVIMDSYVNTTKELI